MEQKLPLIGSLTLNSIIENWSTQAAGLKEKGTWRGLAWSLQISGAHGHTVCCEVTRTWGRVSDLREEGLGLSNETLMLYFPPGWTIGDFTRCLLA